MGQTNLPSSTELKSLSRIQMAILNVLCACETSLTNKAIGEKLNLHPSTIARATADLKFQKVYQGICIAAGNMKFKDVFESTTNLAVAGSAEHQKLFYKIVRTLHDKVQDKPPDVPDDDDDIEQLMNKQKELEEKLGPDAVDAEFEDVTDERTDN